MSCLHRMPHGCRSRAQRKATKVIAWPIPRRHGGVRLPSCLRQPRECSTRDEDHQDGNQPPPGPIMAGRCDERGGPRTQQRQGERKGHHRQCQPRRTRLVAQRCPKPPKGDARSTAAQERHQDHESHTPHRTSQNKMVVAFLRSENPGPAFTPSPNLSTVTSVPSRPEAVSLLPFHRSM